MNLSELAFRHRAVLFLLTVTLMAAGVFSYFSLPAREDPEITIREAVVTTHYPGMSAERVERLITKTLEEAIRQVPEIEEIRSSSMPGVSIIHAEAHARYFDLDQIWDDLRNRVEQARNDLPEGTLAPLVNSDFGDVAVVTAALTADDFEMRDKFDIAKHVRDHLYSVEGTKRVDLHGVQAERIFIQTSNARLSELGVSPDSLIAALSDQNIIRPGGELDTGTRSYVIEPTGNFDSVEDIKETLIRLAGGELVPIRDIANVQRGYIDPPERLAYYNGRPAVIFAVAMLEGQRVLEFAPRVKSRLQETEANLPAGYQISLVTYQADQVEASVYGVSISVVQTLAIVVAICILFLGIRTGLIVGAVVPAVMLVTLAVMGFWGLDLQRMSLATLVIALGLLVDNGIVIAEDFKRRLEDGVDRDEAVVQSGGELAMPLLASTLTTVLVFLPLMMAEHQAGEYTRSISLVILITLSASWFLALTILPILCHRFIRPSDTRGERVQSTSNRSFKAINALYERLLRSVMRSRAKVLLSMLGLMAISIFAIVSAPQKFFPDSDRAQVLVYIDMPAGVSTRVTNERMQSVFQALNDRSRFPYVRSHAGYVGYGGPRFVLSLTPIDPASNKGFIVLNIDHTENIDRAVSELRVFFQANLPDAQARVSRMFLGPTDPGVIQIQVKGPDAGFVFESAESLKSILGSVPGTIDIWSNWENRVPKIVVEVDQTQARRAGVTSADVARSMERFFSGQVISEFREGDDVFPIVARAEDFERGDLDRLRTMAIHGQSTGASVPLIQMADVSLLNDYSRIERENLTRTLTVEARNIYMSPEDMVPIVQQQLDQLSQSMPPGHSVEFDGIVEDSADGRAALAANIPLCIAIIAIILVAQFSSFRRPLIIFLTIPLILIGAAVALYVMGADFGFMVILGLFSLAGIIINNAIVLLSRIDIERRLDGTDDFEAIVNASVQRLRPIVMTTVTTALGLLPLILSQDPLFFGMASVIAFGLMVGTVLTLGVVPILYSLFFGIAPASSNGRPEDLDEGSTLTLPSTT